MQLFYVKRKTTRRAMILAAFALILVLLLIHTLAPAPGLAVWSFFGNQDESEVGSDVLDFIGNIYQSVSPSVVGVTASNGVNSSQNGSGSGLIISEEGYIITNYHVIAGAQSLQVSLSDGRTAAAEVVGSAPKNDLALLQIALADIQPAVMGSSSRLRVGDVVFPIGNPGGEQFARSMTMGLISGIDREMTLSDGNLYLLLQTDAAINPGNSGGPLVNAKGEVIGINSVKIVDADFEGMGFAIPINIVKEFISTWLPNFFD